MGYLLLWLVVAAITGMVASRRGRSGGTWFVLGFLFSFFALLALMMMPDLSEEQQAEDNAALRRCPYCAERIRREAIRCKHCHSEVDSLPAIEHEDRRS
jgi:hypothetical protein